MGASWSRRPEQMVETHQSRTKEGSEFLGSMTEPQKDPEPTRLLCQIVCTGAFELTPAVGRVRRAAFSGVLHAGSHIVTGSMTGWGGGDCGS